jgi:hypothetical protein
MNAIPQHVVANLHAEANAILADPERPESLRRTAWRHLLSMRRQTQTHEIDLPPHAA